MTGADILIKTALACGIEVCFANAGTTEIQLVAALDRQPGIKPVLCLFEGVCTGAADGYGRMKNGPALALLHLGPGLANGIANLHNARRARSPVVNLIGEHATWHKAADPPLAMPIETLASSVSAWQRTANSAELLSTDMAEVVQAALRGQIASLIVPSDLQLAEISDQKVECAKPSFEPPDEDLIDASARTLEKGARAALVLGGPGLFGRGLEIAGKISAATGCMLLSTNFAGRVDRGVGLPLVQRIPYFPEAARELASRIDDVVMAGSWDPVTFFGYPGVPSYVFGSDKEIVRPWKQGQNVVAVLAGIADAVGKNPGRKEIDAAEQWRPDLPGGSLTAEKACRVLAALQPEGCIVVEEGISSAFAYYPLTEHLPHFSLLAVSGGAIGYGLPCAVGAALACPDRKVITFEADGSAMYTVQALWTQAQQNLDVVNIILSNRSYNIVKVELQRAGINEQGATVRALTEIDHPPIDWVRLAKGFGVRAVSVETAEGMATELRQSLAEKGPSLIEVRL